MNRYLGRASYLVAFTLIAIPLFDATMSVMPARLGDSRWRFGTVGLLSNALMIPLAGALIAFATAAALEHRRVLRAGAVVAWIAMATCLFAFVAFVLDALQSQSQIRPGMQLSFAVATGTALAKILIGSTGFALMGVAGFKTLPGPAKPAKRTSVLIPAEKVQKTAT